MFLRLACAAALTLSLFLPASAEAQTEERSRSHYAFAYFYQIDPNGCDVYEAFLDVVERSVRTGPGPWERSTTLSLQSLRYDTCTETYWVVQGTTPIPAGAFHMHGVAGASLQTTVHLTDRGTWELVPVVFDLHWSCINLKGSRRGFDASCAPMELTGSVIVQSRDLMSSEYLQGELWISKSPEYGPGIPALGGAPSQDHSRLYDAFAYFYDFDPARCDLFESYLEVQERTIRAGTGPTRRSTTLLLQSTRYDTCTEDYSVVEGVVELPAEAFRSQGIKEASVRFTTYLRQIPGGEAVPVTIDLRWTCDPANARRDRGSSAACSPTELAGSVLVGSRELMEARHKSGDLSVRRYPGHGPSR